MRRDPVERRPTGCGLNDMPPCGTDRAPSYCPHIYIVFNKQDRPIIGLKTGVGAMAVLLKESDQSIAIDWFDQIIGRTERKALRLIIDNAQHDDWNVRQQRIVLAG